MSSHLHIQVLREPKTLKNCLDSIYSVAISPDNQYVISGSADKSIKIFNIEKGKEVIHFKNVHARNYYRHKIAL